MADTTDGGLSLIIFGLALAAMGVLVLMFYLTIHKFRRFSDLLLALADLGTFGSRHTLDDVAEIGAEIGHLPYPLLVNTTYAGDPWVVLVTKAKELVGRITDELIRREDPEWQHRDAEYAARLRILERGENIAQDINRAVRIEVLKVQERDQTHRHAEMLKIIAAHTDLGKVLVLVQEEARKNPGFNDIVRQVETVYERLAKINPADPNAGLDYEALADLIEQIAISRIKKETK